MYELKMIESEYYTHKKNTGRKDNDSGKDKKQVGQSVAGTDEQEIEDYDNYQQDTPKSTKSIEQLFSEDNNSNNDDMENNNNENLCRLDRRQFYRNRSTGNDGVRVKSL